MNLNYTLKTLGLILCLGCVTMATAQIEIRLQKAQRDYAVNEPISIEIISRSRGELRYLIRESLRTWPVLEQRVAFNSDTLRLSYTHNEPAFLVIETFLNGQYQVASFTVGKEQIQALDQEPADFDAFWQNQKDQLAAIPMDLSENFLRESPYSRTYNFSLAQIDGRRVYGYLVMPKGQGPFPASLRLPPFGRGPNSALPDTEAAERANCIALSISIHNTPINQEDTRAYEPNDLRDPEGVYYRYAILAAIRALDYLQTKTEWNGRDLMIYGDSQGGGLAMLVAGIDGRPNLLVQSVAALSQHHGILYDDPSGFPYFIETARALYSNDAAVMPQVHNAVQYYDAVHAARRFKGVSMHFSNYLDDICPPSTNYAAFNAMPGSKINLHTFNRYHSNVPEYVNDLHDFTRLYFEAATRPPFTFGSSRRGYLIDAGPTRLTRTDSAITLGAKLRYDGREAESDWKVQWKQLDGPAQAHFSNPNAVDAPVSFPDSGTYTLQLRAIDPLPEDPMKFWELVDMVTVYASPGQKDTLLSNPNEPNYNTGSSSVEDPALAELSVFPNPASTELRIRGSLSTVNEYRLCLRDALGREMLSSQALSGTEIDYRFSTSELESGIYLLQISWAQGSLSRWVMLQH